MANNMSGNRSIPEAPRRTLTDTDPSKSIDPRSTNKHLTHKSQEVQKHQQAKEAKEASAPIGIQGDNNDTQGTHRHPSAPKATHREASAPIGTQGDTSASKATTTASNGTQNIGIQGENNTQNNTQSIGIQGQNFGTQNIQGNNGKQVNNSGTQHQPKFAF